MSDAPVGPVRLTSLDALLAHLRPARQPSGFVFASVVGDELPRGLLTGRLRHGLWPAPAFISWLPRVVLAGLALVVAAVFGIGGARAEWRRYQRQSAPSPTRHACAAGCRRA